MKQLKNKHPYKDSYLIYSRKSTDDAENQKNSIAYQTAECLRFVKSKGLVLANAHIEGFCRDGIISENHTGFKEDDEFEITEDGKVQFEIQRPKFQKLVISLFNNEFKGVVILCWDRASRNQTDNNVISRLMAQGKDILFVQAEYNQSSSGMLHMGVDGMFAQYYSKNISEKVTSANKKMKAEGICTYRAPLGYINNGNPRNKPFDPERAPIVKQLFEKYSEGNWSLADMAKWANEAGLTMRPVRRKRTPQEILSDEKVEIKAVARPLTFNHIHKILTNLFYTGLVLGNDRVWVKSASHAPLISEDLFYKVQGLLNTKKVSIHYKNTLYFPYRGLIRCDKCQRVYSPYQKKGIHYYGARCVDGCSNLNKSINANFIEKKVGSILFSLYFSDIELAVIDKQVRGEVATLDADRIEKIKSLERQKRKLRSDLTYLRTNKLSLLKNETYTGEDYLLEEKKIAENLEKLRIEEETLDVSMQETVKDVILLSELLKDAYLYYTLANSSEKQKIISKIFSELTVSGETLLYKAKKGFKVLENRKSLICDPTGNRTPI